MRYMNPYQAAQAGRLPGHSLPQAPGGGPGLPGMEGGPKLPPLPSPGQVKEDISSMPRLGDMRGMFNGAKGDAWQQHNTDPTLGQQGEGMQMGGGFDREARLQQMMARYKNRTGQDFQGGPMQQLPPGVTPEMATSPGGAAIPPQQMAPGKDGNPMEIPMPPGKDGTPMEIPMAPGKDGVNPMDMWGGIDARLVAPGYRPPGGSGSKGGAPATDQWNNVINDLAPGSSGSYMNRFGRSSGITDGAFLNPGGAQPPSQSMIGREAAPGGSQAPQMSNRLQKMVNSGQMTQEQAQNAQMRQATGMSAKEMGKFRGGIKGKYGNAVGEADGTFGVSASPGIMMNQGRTFEEPGSAGGWSGQIQNMAAQIGNLSPDSLVKYGAPKTQGGQVTSPGAQGSGAVNSIQAFPAGDARNDLSAMSIYEQQKAQQPPSQAQPAALPPGRNNPLPSKRGGGGGNVRPEAQPSTAPAGGVKRPPKRPGSNQ